MKKWQVRRVNSRDHLSRDVKALAERQKQPRDHLAKAEKDGRGALFCKKRDDRLAGVTAEMGRLVG